jgi:hypothetical protein
MGASVTARRLGRIGAISGIVCCALATLATSAPAEAAGERYALVITGASGGGEYAAKYQGWRNGFTRILKDDFGYPADHVKVLAEDLPEAERSNRVNVRAAFADLRKRTTDGDLTVILLMGHGTSEAGDAKFNLVGPDLTLDEWASLVQPLRGRVAFINASSGSFPFIPAIAGKDRVVLSANDSAEQQFETLFPEFFIKAFADEAGDTDKNGKVSLLEAFTFASANVKDSFEQRGRLATERALLDDTGGGTGRDVDTTGRDGQLAQITYLEPEVPASLAGNAELANLMRRRAELENRLDLLRTNKDRMPAARYEEELEELLLEVARIDRRLRTKT